MAGVFAVWQGCTCPFGHQRACNTTEVLEEPNILSLPSKDMVSPTQDYQSTNFSKAAKCLAIVVIHSRMLHHLKLRPIHRHAWSMSAAPPLQILLVVCSHDDLVEISIQRMKAMTRNRKNQVTKSLSHSPKAK